MKLSWGKHSCAIGIGDTALFYCERWAPQVGVATPNVAAHFDRRKARPSVRRAPEVYGES